MLTVPHLFVQGDLTSAATLTPGLATILNAHVAPDAAIARTKLQRENYAPVDIDINSMRVWDDLGDLLPGAASGDDLAIEDNASFGSSTSPYISGGDVGGIGTDRYARGMVALPPEYVSGSPVRFEIFAGFLTNAPDDAGFLDLSVYKSNQEAGIGSDLVTTEQIDIASTTISQRNFAITSTGLVAGDLLDFRVHVSTNDVGDAGTMVPVIGSIQLGCQIQG